MSQHIETTGCSACVHILIELCHAHTRRGAGSTLLMGMIDNVSTGNYNCGRVYRVMDDVTFKKAALLVAVTVLGKVKFAYMFGGIPICEWYMRHFELGPMLSCGIDKRFLV